MLVQHCETDLLHGARIVRRSPRVIDDPVVRAVAGDARLAEKDHHVKGILLDPGLVEKEQIAGLCLLAIAAYESGVVELECLRVGEV